MKSERCSLPMSANKKEHSRHRTEGIVSRSRVLCTINCCYANRERVQVRDDDWMNGWPSSINRHSVVPTELWVKCRQTALAALIVREERTVSRRFRPRCPIVSVNKFLAARVSAHLIKTKKGWTPLLCARLFKNILPLFLEINVECTALKEFITRNSCN